MQLRKERTVIALGLHLLLGKLQLLQTSVTIDSMPSRCVYEKKDSQLRWDAQIYFFFRGGMLQVGQSWLNRLYLSLKWQGQTSPGVVS